MKPRFWVFCANGTKARRWFRFVGSTASVSRPFTVSSGYSYTGCPILKKVVSFRVKRKRLFVVLAGGCQVSLYRVLIGLVHFGLPVFLQRLGTSPPKTMRNAVVSLNCSLHCKRRNKARMCSSIRPFFKPKTVNLFQDKTVKL